MFLHRPVVVPDCSFVKGESKNKHLRVAHEDMLYVQGK
jgi:hypothetical protein